MNPITWHLVRGFYFETRYWHLVCSDEFNGNGLPDASKWDYDLGGHGWGNNERQYYTANDLDNSRVENDLLIIEAPRENFGGNACTSARLVTRNKGDGLYGIFWQEEV